jgi:hypothetical protein
MNNSNCFLPSTSKKNQEGEKEPPTLVRLREDTKTTREKKNPVS